MGGMLRSTLPWHWGPRCLRPWLSAAAHLRRMPDTLVCPVYHTAWDRSPPYWDERYPVKTLRQLEQDLDDLLRLSEPLELAELLDWAAGRRSRPRGWFLSFDDGYRELAQQIAPLLSRKGVPATFFCVRR